MTRIRSTNIRFGENFVLPIEKVEENKPESPELIKLKEQLRILNLEVEEAKKNKVKILEDAKNQSKAMIEEANQKIAQENEEIAKKREEDKKAFDESIAQEAEKIRTETYDNAYKAGYDDGYKQGYAVITNELENKIHAVDDFAKCQFELKNNIIKSSELDIINLIVEIAKKVCSKSVELNPEILKILTENAIKELKDKENITITINPKLLESLNSVSDKLKEDIPQLESIKIIEDNSVSADGTIVESLLTRVDSRVKSQINEIAERLFEVYNSEDENFENYIASLEEPDIDALEQIELSDDVNINEFLNELEDIPSYENKIRDEDAEYYENLDLEELKNSDEEVGENSGDVQLDTLNIDEFEEENQEVKPVVSAEDVVQAVPVEKIENTQEEPQMNNDIQFQESQIEETPVEASVIQEIQPEEELVQEDIVQNTSEISVQNGAVETTSEEPQVSDSEPPVSEINVSIEEQNPATETVSNDEISSIKEELAKIKNIEESLSKTSQKPQVQNPQVQNPEKQFSFPKIEKPNDIEDEVFKGLDINEKFDELFSVDDNNLMGGDNV